MQSDVVHLADYRCGALASLSFKLQVWAALSMLTDLRNRTVMLHFLAITGELPARSLMHSSQIKKSVHFSTFCAAGTVQNCKQAAQTFTSRAYPSLKIKEKVNLSFAGFAKLSSQCSGATLDLNIPVTGGTTCYTSLNCSVQLYAPLTSQTALHNLLTCQAATVEAGIIHD